MAEVKWIKLNVDMFDDEKIKIIQAMPDGDALLVVWIKLIALAGKTNDGGYIYISENIPYTEEMLAVIMNKPLLTIRLAMETFINLGMAENDTKGIYLLNFEKHQSLDKMEKIKEQTRKRVAKYRENRKALNGSVTSNADVTQCNATDIDIDKEEEKEEEYHSIIHSATGEEEFKWETPANPNDPSLSPKLEYLKGTLGEGLVLMSDIQFDDLCDKLSYDEINKYFGIIVECEKKGKHFKKKSHYQAILEMAMKDRKKIGS